MIESIQLRACWLVVGVGAFAALASGALHDEA
jgi:hypothetical protein